MITLSKQLHLVLLFYNECLCYFISIVNSVQFHNDNTCVVSGSADKTIKVWDVRTHQLIQHYQAHTDAVTSVSMHPVSFSRLSEFGTVFIDNFE